MKIRMLPVLSLALGFALACSGGSTETTTAPPPPPPPADGKIGVPECDDYITKMEACIKTADPMAKGPMESGLKTTKDAWLQAASNPQTKAVLASSCTAMVSSIPTNCGSGAAAGTPPADPAAGTAAGTPTDPAAGGAAAGTPPADGTAAAAGTTTTTTTTTVVTTTDDKKTSTEPVKASSTGARAPARDSRPAADMGRSRDAGSSGSTKSGSRDTKSGSSGSGGSSGGMGRSR